MQLPLFTQPTEWVMPETFPRLGDAKEIAIDLETYDPNLRNRGSGWPRGDGHIIGVAVAVAEGAWYFPIRHEMGQNLDAKRVMAYVKDLCADPAKTYIFHNAAYDVGWLRAEGVEVKGRIVDTMVVAPLLDENRFSYALNSLGRDYLNERKDERLLKESAKDFGVDAKAEMYKLPAAYVGAYAEQDAALTLKLWNHFKGLVIKEEIGSIVDLELKVLRVIIEMRSKGVRVDLERAALIKKDLERREKEILNSITKQYGVSVDIWAAASVAKAFDAAGLTYGVTEKTSAPSFGKSFLKTHKHELPRMVVQARELNKARTTFIDAILKHEHHGRIHAEIHSLRSDEGGTVTGRFSYSEPNLQQIPARNAEIGPLIRSLFLPEQGEQWGAFDYSSQEPRLVVHYASLLDFDGARDFVDEYSKDARTDFHALAASIVGVPRKQAKDINLGLFYGMGKNKLADSLGLDLPEAEQLFKVYHDRVPFVKQLSEYTSNRAATKGVIRTLLGRRCRFDLWEPNKYGVFKPLQYKEAFNEHGSSIRRAFTYKALNRLIQGSAADQTKQAMVALYENGVLPMIQVHDELDISVGDPKLAQTIQDIMENCVDLKVPSIVDAEFGPNWGEAKLTFADKPWTRGLKDGHSEMEN